MPKNPKFEFIPKTKLYPGGIHYWNFWTIALVAATLFAMAQQVPHKHNNSNNKDSKDNKNGLFRELGIKNVKDIAFIGNRVDSVYNYDELNNKLIKWSN